MYGIPNDVDIEMMEAVNISNEIGAATGPIAASSDQVALLTSWLTADINRGGQGLWSPSEGLLQILQDNPEYKINDEQFSEITWQGWEDSNKGED